jgi:para-nitrobenzyl esterase
LFAKAIGQSGSFFRTRDTDDDRLDMPLAKAERLGLRFAKALGAGSIAELRALPADAILRLQVSSEAFEMTATFDGFVMPADSVAAWEVGRQAHVPLLAGWTADEQRASATFGSKRPTAKSFIAKTRKRYGDRADAVLRLYPAGSDEEAVRSAGDLAGDQFIAYCTWRMIELQLETGQSPVYRYSFDRKCPVEPTRTVNGAHATGTDVGATHASDIPYTFGDLAGVPGVSWEPADWKLSDAMEAYWSNFAKKGDPNGPGLPEWPRYDRDGGYQVQHLDVSISTAPEKHRERYEFWSADAAKVGK